MTFDLFAHVESRLVARSLRFYSKKFRRKISICFLLSKIVILVIKMAKNDPQYWLLKVEPSDYPWSKMESDGTTTWNGIHNHQAQKYLKTMKCDDLAFYYHTEKEKAIVGIVKVAKEFYHNVDPKFGEVDVKCVRALNPVTLKVLKETADLQSMMILKQPRLSVSPVTFEQWNCILALSEDADE